MLQQEIPSVISVEIGTYLESARVIGVRMAELHLALASEPDDKEFAPEAFTPAYQRALLQSMRNVAVHNLRRLRKQLRTLPQDLLPLAHQVADLEGAIIQRYRELFGHRLSAKRIRIHGDCHLGELVWNRKGLLLLRFSRAICSRRLANGASNGRPCATRPPCCVRFITPPLPVCTSTWRAAASRQRTCPASSPGWDCGPAGGPGLSEIHLHRLDKSGRCRTTHWNCARCCKPIFCIKSSANWAVNLTSHLPACSFPFRASSFW